MRFVWERIASAFVVAAAVFLVAGCGSGGGKASDQTRASTSTGATSASGSCAHGWEWDSEDPVCAPSTTIDESVARAVPSRTEAQPPDGPTLGELTATGTAGTQLDPCTLVSTDEWARAAGVSAVRQMPLEEGEACGFVESSDSIRLAIGFVPVDSDGHHFLDAAPTHGEAVPALPDTWWLTKYPVAQSSVLVVQRKGGDLVLEVSTITPPTDAQRDAAITVAILAVGRL